MGWITAEGTAARHSTDVEAALPCMRHRGPDESGVWHDDDVALGFNRLSIIDVEGSHQPLEFPGDATRPRRPRTGRYRIVFNGEIYNYLELREELAREHGVRFATEGDTEAIVAAYSVWGADAVPAAARHVHVPHLGHPGARALRRPRPVRHQAAVLRRRARTASPSPARRRACSQVLEPLGAARRPRRTPPRCSTT